jgi:hypothetical protein
MEPNLTAELTTLKRLTPQQLRDRYATVFGETTRAANKAWLLKRIAWRLQALAEGDPSERAHRRAAELAYDADLRLTPRRAATITPKGPPPAAAVPPPPARDARLPCPGTVLTRPYRGEVLDVRVLADGFEHAGTIYPSLSAVARAITGSYCNGFLFFRNALNHRGPA